MGTVDRISDLPDIMLHDILSALDTKEACRASVLSKRWHAAWSSIPVLDFQPKYFEYWDDSDGSWGGDCNSSASFDDDVSVARFVKYVDKTMRRYSEQKFRIRKLILRLHEVDEKLQPFVDRWLRIAVENQIRELDIGILLDCSPAFLLPEILFRAKSLKVLTCDNLEVPYYETMELISLKCLNLLKVVVDADLFQRIVSCCPLVDLNVEKISHEQISLPWKRKVNKILKCFGSETMQSNFKASPLTKFVCDSTGYDLPWPRKVNVGALKNLRKVEIVGANVTDDIISELTYGLVGLESLVLTSCLMLKYLKISSVSLKKFEISGGLGLKSATIDNPNMVNFSYNCKVMTSLLFIKAHDHCIGSFQPLMEYIDYVWFVKLKNFLVKTRVFKCLALELSGAQTEVEVDVLRNVQTGLPYKLRELKFLGPTAWEFNKYFLAAILDGLFWSCHPDVLSIKAGLQASAVKDILDILKHKVQCREHPSRSVKVEGVDCSSLLLDSSDVEIRWRLSWASV